MARSEFTIQGLTSKSADASMSASESVNVGELDVVNVHVQRPTGANTGSVLVMQTAPSQADARFVDLMPPVDLSKTGDIEVCYSKLSKYLRWRVIVTGGTAQFSISAVGWGSS